MVTAALKASDWIIFGMPSSKKLYFVWLIVAITTTCPIMAQPGYYFSKNHDFMAFDHPNWVFTLSGSPENCGLPDSYSFRQSLFNDATVFSEPIARVSESFQINPSVVNLTSSSVPEPATICILGVGLLVLIKLCRRRHPGYA